jgi:hypothetical protein
MYRFLFEIEGTAPYSQSHQHYTDYVQGETHEEYDARTWREKCNYNPLTGEVHIPAMAIKMSLDTAAKRLEIKDPDNKRAKLTKNFTSGVICETHVPIGIKKDDMPMVTIPANVDGVRGSGKRVPRRFPQTQKWSGQGSLMIMDPKVKPEMVKEVFDYAGMTIGIGQFRPEKGGLNGRFKLKKFNIEKVKV